MNASAWHDGRLYVRLAGAIAAVDAASSKLGGATLAADEALKWWSSLRDQTQAFFSLDDTKLAGGEQLWRLSVPRSAAPIALSGAQVIEWHGAERWWRTASAAEDVRAAAARAGGHATLIRGACKSGGVFAPVSEVLMRVHRGLKRAFDPAGVFNPGRLYAGL
jgi:FAD/FMN-containing dehydrogenase